jgi:uncharacterized protein involved in exopolysaccharide biosynthesis
MAGTRVRRWLAAAVGVAVLAVGALVALRATQHAEARDAATVSPSCSTRLLRDWTDGRIDRTYPIRCYRDALESLPADLQIYSSAPDDIAQALSRRLQGRAARDARTLAGAKRG